jgi:hypothetical protein
MMKSMYQNEVRRKRSAESNEALSNAYCSAASSVNAPGLSAWRGWRSVINEVEEGSTISKAPRHGVSSSSDKLSAKPEIKLEIREM